MNLLGINELDVQRNTTLEKTVSHTATFKTPERICYNLTKKN
jgi:hypothetical protein